MEGIPAQSPDVGDFKTSPMKAYLVLGVLMMLNIVNYMDRNVINVALEAIKNDLMLSDLQLGLMQSVFFIGVGVMIYPTGILIDRWSRKYAVALMTIIWSLATVMTGWSGSFLVLLFARFWCGSGEAGFQPGGTAWLSVVFEPKHRTKVTGVFLSAGILGIILGMSLGGHLIQSTGTWRTPFYIFGVMGVILGLTAVILPDAKAAKPKGPRPKLLAETRELFKNKTFLNVSLAQGFYLARSMAASGFGVVILLRAYDLTEAQAGLYLSISVIPAILSPAVGGFLADWMHKRNPLTGRPMFTVYGSIIAFVLPVIQLLIVGYVPIFMYLLFLVVNAIFGSIHVATWQVINMDVFSVEQRGKAAAMLGLVSFLIFSWWGATLVGWMSDCFGSGLNGLRYAMLLMQPFVLIAAYYSYKSVKSYAHDKVAE